MEENQELKKALWAISNDLRGNMDATKFKDYILGVIFYRFLSYNIETAIKEIDDSMTFAEHFAEDAQALQEECLSSVGYFIEPKYLFDEVAKRAINNDFIIEDLADALTAIENSTSGHDSQGDFEGLFSDLNLYSQDLGINVEDKNEKICKILARLSEVDFKFENSEIDVLGDAYEYMISMFASDAGKKAGEFYTPQSVSKILTKIIASEKTNITSVYDPTCGSGSLLLRAVRELGKDSITKIAGEELNTTTFNLARMNMLIHNVKYDNFNIFNTNTLEKPKLLDERFDAVVANPPFSAKWSAAEHFNEDPRFREYAKLAPKGKADFAFVQHMLYQTNEEGIVATVLPHGPLFRGAAEKVIREKLLKDNNIDAIIGLPQNIFFGTSIPTIILVLKKCKSDDKVLFIDASKEFEKAKNQNILTEDNINKIITTYQNREELEKFSHLATLEEIEENDFNLNIPRYVDTFEEEEPIDIKQVSKEYQELVEEEKNIRKDLLSQLEDLNGDEEVLKAIKAMLEVR